MSILVLREYNIFSYHNSCLDEYLQIRMSIYNDQILYKHKKNHSIITSFEHSQWQDDASWLFRRYQS